MELYKTYMNKRMYFCIRYNGYQYKYNSNINCVVIYTNINGQFKVLRNDIKDINQFPEEHKHYALLIWALNISLTEEELNEYL